VKVAIIEVIEALMCNVASGKRRFKETGN